MSGLNTQWVSRKAGMFATYFSAAIRQMSHNKFASGINILSLAIGLTVALIVILFVRHELSYDQWIPNAENVYRFETKINQTNGGSIFIAQTYPPAAPVLKSRFSEIEAITRLHFNIHSLHRRKMPKPPIAGCSNKGLIRPACALLGILLAVA